MSAIIKNKTITIDLKAAGEWLGIILMAAFVIGFAVFIYKDEQKTERDFWIGRYGEDNIYQTESGEWIVRARDGSLCVGHFGGHLITTVNYRLEPITISQTK